MQQAYRDEFWFFLNTTPNELTSNFEREGHGVETLGLSFNPQMDQFKDIISRNSDAQFQNYQIQSSVSRRIYKGDPVFAYLNDLRRKAKASETQMVEVDSAEAGTTPGSYIATKYNVLIVITDWLSDGATAGYDLYVKGDPVQGTATISEGKAIFTETQVSL